MQEINYLEQKKNMHLYFQSGESMYAVNTANVLEIMKLPALDYPQKLPNNIIGLLKYNNFVINVLDIRFYLNIDVTPYSVDHDLIILKTDEVIVGLIADKVIGLLSFDTASVEQIPFVDKRMIIESLYKHNNETIFTINVYALESLLKEHDEYSSNVNIQDLFPKSVEDKKLMTSRALGINQKGALQIASTNLLAQNKYISLSMNDDYYCIYIDCIKEVLKNAQITPIPGTPNFIDGLMNLRGDYITVIDLKTFLGIESTTVEVNNKENNEEKPVIVIECNDFYLALKVDRINELFEAKIVEESVNKDSYYLSEFIYNDCLYTELNIDRICSDKRIFITEI